MKFSALTLRPVDATLTALVSKSLSAVLSRGHWKGNLPSRCPVGKEILKHTSSSAYLTEQVANRVSAMPRPHWHAYYAQFILISGYQLGWSRAQQCFS